MCKYVVLQEDNRPIDPYLEKMINDIKAKGVNQPEVLDAFKVVDRKYFMNFAEPNEDSEINQIIIQAQGDRTFNPYSDFPRPIGWNTTISAPSMHAETLRHLLPVIKTAKNILDIGTGSGFVTAAMAHLSPDDCQVYGIDHIKEINQFAEKNIKTICPHLWRKHKITLVTQDGRKGLASYNSNKMQYDIIHFGGQLNEIEDQEQVVEAKDGNTNSRKLRIDSVILEQLAPGGLMWIPLLSKDPISPERQILEQIFINSGRAGNTFEHHQVYLVEKDKNTHKLTYTKIMDARYAQLKSVDEQLSERR